jgi:prolipoprotein diacylglyceryltransferase
MKPRFWTPSFIVESAVNLVGFGILAWFCHSMKWPWYAPAVLYFGLALADFRTKAPAWWER